MGAILHTIPDHERPRERLLLYGTENLSDTELLAIILRVGNASSGENAIDQARALLAHFSNLRALVTAGIAEITAHPGIGPAKACQVKAALELGRRATAEEPLRDRVIRSSQDIYLRFGAMLAGRRTEVFYALLLDGKNRCLKECRINEGTLTSCVVHPREVFGLALRECAAAIILLHNHPSGDPTPSPDDEALTRRMCRIGELVGIPVLDHVVIGDGRYESFIDMGRLPPRCSIPFE